MLSHGYYIIFRSHHVKVDTELSRHEKVKVNEIIKIVFTQNIKTIKKVPHDLHFSLLRRHSRPTSFNFTQLQSSEAT